MFSQVSLELRVPKGQLLRNLYSLVDGIIINTSALLDQRYSHIGRPSNSVEKLLEYKWRQIPFFLGRRSDVAKRIRV